MKEQLDIDDPAFRPEYGKRALRAAESARLLDAAEPIAEPTVQVPEGFNLKAVVRLPERTPEEMAEMRADLDGPSLSSSGSRPSAYGEPIHEGKRRSRHHKGGDQ